MLARSMPGYGKFSPIPESRFKALKNMRKVFNHDVGEHCSATPPGTQIKGYSVEKALQYYRGDIEEPVPSSVFLPVMNPEQAPGIDSLMFFGKYGIGPASGRPYGTLPVVSVHKSSLGLGEQDFTRALLHEVIGHGVLNRMDHPEFSGLLGGNLRFARCLREEYKRRTGDSYEAEAGSDGVVRRLSNKKIDGDIAREVQAYCLTGKGSNTVNRRDCVDMDAAAHAVCVDPEMRKKIDYMHIDGGDPHTVLQERLMRRELARARKEERRKGEEEYAKQEVRAVEDKVRLDDRGRILKRSGDACVKSASYVFISTILRRYVEPLLINELNKSGIMRDNPQVRRYAVRSVIEAASVGFGVCAYSPTQALIGPTMNLVADQVARRGWMSQEKAERLCSTVVSAINAVENWENLPEMAASMGAGVVGSTIGERAAYAVIHRLPKLKDEPEAIPVIGIKEGGFEKRLSGGVRRRRRPGRDM